MELLGLALPLLTAMTTATSTRPLPPLALARKIPPPPPRPRRRFNRPDKPPKPPRISMRSYEKRIRQLLEAHTGSSWGKRRMASMMNPLTGKALELDLYNAELNVAVEYNGIQHVKVVKHYHPRGQADLDEQIKRDRMKQALCKQNGIALAVIHYGEIHEDMLDTDILKLCIGRIAESVKKLSPRL